MKEYHELKSGAEFNAPRFRVGDCVDTVRGEMVVSDVVNCLTTETDTGFVIENKPVKVQYVFEQESGEDIWLLGSSEVFSLYEESRMKEIRERGEVYAFNSREEWVAHNRNLA